MTTENLIGIIIVWVFGVVLFFFAFKRLKLKRIIENIPTSKIRSMAMGLVELEGNAIAIDQNILKTPFTNRDALIYEYRLERYVRNGNKSEWRTIKRGREEKKFYIKDDTGKVLVNPKFSELVIKEIKGTPESIPSSLGLIKRNLTVGFSVMGKGRVGSLRYFEKALIPNAHCYLMGSATKNKNVNIGSAITNESNIIVQKGSEKIFIISDEPQKKIIKKFFWQALISFICSIILLVIGVIMIILKTGG